MDKQFENAIKKMDTLSGKAGELQEHVSSLFKKVENTQGTIDGKIDQINKDLEKVMGNFEEESEKLFTDIKSEFDKQKTEGDNSINEITGKVESHQKEYKSKVKDLIKSIDSKSKEILKIYDELAKIKKIEEDAAKTFGKLADEQKEVIVGFKNDTAKLIKAMDIGKIKKIVDSFEDRLLKLEENAHKHTFGGTKV